MMTQAEILRKKAAELLKKAAQEENKALIEAGKLALAYHQAKLTDMELKAKLEVLFGNPSTNEKEKGK